MPHCPRKEALGFQPQRFLSGSGPDVRTATTGCPTGQSPVIDLLQSRIRRTHRASLDGQPMSSIRTFRGCALLRYTDQRP